MNLSDFDFFVPEELVAQKPLDQRDASRMMVVHRKTGLIEQKQFKDLVHYLSPQDILVFNSSKVVKARLLGQREGSGGRVEIFLLKKIGVDIFECLVKATAAKKEGLRIKFGEHLWGTVLPETPTPMVFQIQFEVTEGKLEDLIEQYGRVPLPPYIHREAESVDLQRYQTVYAEQPGSVAAPTAGLHFTPEYLAGLKAKNISLRQLILHVGLGTFQPIKTENIEAHRMHEEEFLIPEDLQKECATAKASGKRVIAVGTTAVRALESCARGKEGRTDIFLKPGEKFLWVDALFTNFHQPKSSLVVLLAAFMGNDSLWREAYRQAVENRYRFFSYGDCMLVL